MKYEEMQSVMPPNEMIEMFTFKMESKQAIETIAQHVPAACETHKFALLYTYNYHEIAEKKASRSNVRFLSMKYGCDGLIQ